MKNYVIIFIAILGWTASNAGFTGGDKKTSGPGEDVISVDAPTIYNMVSNIDQTNFKVEKSGNFNHVSWNVYTSGYNNYIEVQRSTDGVNFTTVGFVIEKDNDSESNYDYFDLTDVKSASTFYRLIEYNNDATKHFSKVFSVQK
jgi:hypothetical protein